MGEKVKVYRFTRYNIDTDRELVAPRFATLETIRQAQGAAIMESEVEVEAAELDGNGFWQPPPPDDDGVPQFGDCLVVVNADGTADVFRILADGQWELVRASLPSAGDARTVGRLSLGNGGQVWIADAATPDRPQLYGK
jgi:hypothetical protein